jgi:hypothetical protein
MRFSLAKSATLLSLAVGSMSAMAGSTVLATGVQGVSLAGGSGCYAMGVAFDSANSQYYGGGGGGPGCNGVVWNAAGARLQSLSPVNVDIRGVNYNTNNGQVEIVGYGSKNGYYPGSHYSGLYEMGLDGAGLYTGVNSQALTQLSGMSDDQSVAAYDASRDVFYSTSSGSNVVNIAKHSDGSLLGTITLQGASVANTELYTIGYDSAADLLIRFDNSTNNALVFDMAGDFVGSSFVGAGNFDNSYSMAYTNGLLFLGTGSGYESFQIIQTSAVPEPTNAALLLVGLLGAAGVSLRRRRA